MFAKCIAALELPLCDAHGEGDVLLLEGEFVVARRQLGELQETTVEG